MKPQPPVTRIRTARASSAEPGALADFKDHTTDTKGPKVHKPMTENEIAKQILDAAFVVHTNLGSGVLNRFTKWPWHTSCVNMV